MTEAILLREFQRLFALLDDYASSNEASGARIREFIAAHLRSSAPMAMAPSPVAEVSRDLADGSRYRISRAESYTMLELSRCDAALTAVEVMRFRHDLSDVASLSNGVSK